jgi:hypothetical protein
MEHVLNFKCQFQSSGMQLWVELSKACFMGHLMVKLKPVYCQGIANRYEFFITLFVKFCIDD